MKNRQREKLFQPIDAMATTTTLLSLQRPGALTNRSAITHTRTVQSNASVGEGSSFSGNVGLPYDDRATLRRALVAGGGRERKIVHTEVQHTSPTAAERAFGHTINTGNKENSTQDERNGDNRAHTRDWTIRVNERAKRQMSSSSDNTSISASLQTPPYLTRTGESMRKRNSNAETNAQRTLTDSDRTRETENTNAFPHPPQPIPPNKFRYTDYGSRLTLTQPQTGALVARNGEEYAPTSRTPWTRNIGVETEQVHVCTLSFFVSVFCHLDDYGDFLVIISFFITLSIFFNSYVSFAITTLPIILCLFFPFLSLYLSFFHHLFYSSLYVCVYFPLNLFRSNVTRTS